jgi:hypothetical protein
VNAPRGIDARRHDLHLAFILIELRSRSAAGKSASVCPPTRQTNDPGGGPKQIQLQYAGIGAAYGCTGDRLQSRKCLKTAGNDGMALVCLSQFTSTCS